MILYINQVKKLIYEYAGYLNRDLSFKNLYEELADFSKKYTVQIVACLYVLKIIK